jgi:hypothetical protein
MWRRLLEITLISNAKVVQINRKRIAKVSRLLQIYINAVQCWSSLRKSDLNFESNFFRNPFITKAEILKSPKCIPCFIGKSLHSDMIQSISRRLQIRVLGTNDRHCLLVLLECNKSLPSDSI